MAETRWPPFSRRHFQMHFPEWKCVNFEWNFTELCSQGSNWQYASIGSDNGLVPNRRQAIIWNNGGLGCQLIYASRGLNELRTGAVWSQCYRYWPNHDFVHVNWVDIIWVVFVAFRHCQVDDLMQERRNSIAHELELRLSCTDPSKFTVSSVIT